MTEMLVGFLIAAGVGLTGVGAGSVMAPILMLFFKTPPAEAIGTTLAFSTITKLVIAPVYMLRKQVDYPTLWRLCYGGIPGTLVGVWVLGLLDMRNHQKALYLAIGLLVASMAIYTLIRSVRRSAHARVMRERSGWLTPIGAGVGASVGFCAAGAGALGSVALLNLTALSLPQVVGTDVMFGLLTSVVGSGFHMTAGHFEWGILLRLTIGGIAGSLIGANLLSVLPARPLRVALAAWLAVLGIQLCWQGLAG